MWQSFNLILQKFMPIITPLGVMTGIIFSKTLEPFIFLVAWLFAFMTFSGSLSLKFSDFKSIKKYTVPLVICLIILHLVMPFIAFMTGNLLFPADLYTVTGLVLSFAIPTGVTSLVWVTIYKGGVVLTLLIILIDTLLAPFLVPSILHLFIGTSVEIDGFDIMNGLIWMIVIPSILGMLLNQATKGKVSKSLSPMLAPFSKLSLGLIVALNSSAVASYFKDMNGKLLFMIVVVFMLACSGYMIGWIVSKLLKLDHETTMALTYNSGMRNIGAGAAIAITYFPAPVAMPVVIGMLFQQIIASLTGSLLSRFNRSKKQKMVI